MSDKLSPELIELLRSQKNNKLLRMTSGRYAGKFCTIDDKGFQTCAFNSIKDAEQAAGKKFQLVQPPVGEATTVGGITGFQGGKGKATIVSRGQSMGGDDDGFHVPKSVKKRKKKVDELLARYSDINEGHVLAYLSTLDEVAGEAVGRWLDMDQHEAVAGWIREHAIREVIAKKVREVVRKKPGGAGYALYSPNMGKKRPPRKVGDFPTKIGAKRAELSRFPPRDSKKLQRLRKEVQRMLKDPKKALGRDKPAKPKKEGALHEDPFTPAPGSKPPPAGGLHNDPTGFMNGLKGLPKDGPQRGQYITSHMNHPPFLSALQKHPQGQQLHSQLTSYLNSPKNAGLSGTKKTSVGTQSALTGEGLLRKVISHLIKESLFREEASGSEWDDVIGKLSSKALTGDKRFQSLQRTIEKKTQGVLESSLSSISKAIRGKDVKVKSFGVKSSQDKGKIYLPFAVTIGEVQVGPIFIYTEAGVPKLEVSDEAKVALTKADPDQAKSLRAELVLVQERVLDRMDDLTSAIEARDRYLEKVESEVDKFVAGLSALQLSLLKRLLVQKYRKMA